MLTPAALGPCGASARFSEMRRLSNDEKAYSLKTAWDTNNTFFQFQVLVRSSGTSWPRRRPARLVATGLTQRPWYRPTSCTTDAVGTARGREPTSFGRRQRELRRAECGDDDATTLGVSPGHVDVLVPRKGRTCTVHPLPLAALRRPSAHVSWLVGTTARATGTSVQETEPIEEIDNVYKRPITIQGAGKKKGLGLGQKFNYRFDIEYDGKVEAFFVEDEATMRSWVECTCSLSVGPAVARPPRIPTHVAAWLPPGHLSADAALDPSGMKESQARRDARNAAAIAASGKQRTLVQIGLLAGPGRCTESVVSQLRGSPSLP